MNLFTDGAIAITSTSRTFTTEDKISSFAHLDEGWSYLEGIAFSQSTIQTSILLSRQSIAEGFLESDAFPGLNGEIILAIYSNGKCLELSVSADGFISSCLESQDGQKIRSVNISVSQAFEKLAELKAECTSLERWTHTTTIEPASVLSVPLFKITGGSLYLTSPALLQPVETFAHISFISTAQSEELPRYSAGSIAEYLPALAS